MAGQLLNPNQTVNPYLSPNQQDLLLAALESQTATRPTTKRSNSDPASDMSATNGNALFMSPQNAELDNLNIDYTPDLDYLDGDSFDFENADLGGEMIGALPGDSREDLTTNGDGHEKRKNPDESDDIETGDAKRYTHRVCLCSDNVLTQYRQETQEGEKGAKKPGRKPLTNEPTTVSNWNTSRINTG